MRPIEELVSRTQLVSPAPLVSRSTMHEYNLLVHFLAVGFH